MKRSELDTGLNQEQLKSGLMYEDEKPEQAKDRQRQYLIVNCGIDADYVMTLDDLQLDGLYKNFGLEKQASSSTQEKPKQGDQPLSERFREVEKIDHESEADAQEVAKVTRKLDPDNIRKSLAGSDGLINVKVRRSSGEIESGWFINNISEDGTLVDVVQNSKEGGHVKTKRVSLKDLIDWNQAPGVEQQQSQPSANTEIVTESDPEDILETPESKNKFVEVFKHKLGIDNTIDAASIAYNGMISEWYEEKSEKSRKSVASMELKIDTLRKDADHIESQLKLFRIDGNISEKTLLKIEAEKQGLLSELGEKEKSLAEERSNLELLRVNKEIFAKKRQESCLTYSERVKAELDPFEERITELKRTRDQLQGEAARDQAFLTHRREEASKIIAKIDAEKFPSLRRANREILKKIEAEASAFEKEIASREIAALDIGKSILKHEKRSEPLRDKLENLKRIMIGEEDLVDSVESISSPTTQITSRENTSRHSLESSARSSEKAEYFDEKELIESWNQLNGSEMMINPEMWRKSEGSKKMTMDQFWSKASLYSARFGKKERMMGMPESKKAPRKLGLFRRLWRWLFGLPEPDISKKRMKENITMNRSRNKTAK